MTPAQARELFSAAFDGELPPEQQAELDATLASDAELSKAYREFCDTMSMALVTSAAQDSAAAPQIPTPDLLPGVQRRLRARSGGRFYADRFAEQSGKGLTGPLALALIMVAVCVLAWVAFNVVQGIEVVR